MRIGILAAVAGVLITSAAHAQGPGFRFGGASSGAWCLFDDPYTYNCGYASVQQCRAAAQGAGGICQPNPSGPPLREAPVRRQREKPRY